MLTQHQHPLPPDDPPTLAPRGRRWRTRFLISTCLLGLGWTITADVAHSASPRLNHTWRLGIHNAYWHGIGSSEAFASGPKQHILDSVYIDRARALEFDLHSVRNTQPGYWAVYHTTRISGYSFCDTLGGCLFSLRAFHYGNPRHDVFFINLESKESSDSGLNTLFDFGDPAGLQLTPEDLDRTLMTYLGDGTTDWIFGPRDYYAWCSARIASGAVPAQPPLDANNLRSAVSKCGWPTMQELRGKFIVTLHGGNILRNNTDYVWEYSHRDGRVIGNMKIFPLAGLHGIFALGGPCNDVFNTIPETGGGVCNWGNHSVLTDISSINPGDYTGGFNPHNAVSNLLNNNGLLRGDGNTRADIAAAVKGVLGLPYGANIVSSDGSRNMLVNYTYNDLANPVPQSPVNWSSGCLFTPDGTEYIAGCDPKALREDSSGVFISTYGSGGLRDGSTHDALAFVHTPRLSTAGAFKAFVSTRTEVEGNYGRTYTGDMGCLMARAGLAPEAPFLAVCRHRHRNSWASATEGAYLLYRTTAGSPTVAQYYDQPDERLGNAELQNFFRLEHSADGRCWQAAIQATADPGAPTGWGPIALRDPLGSTNFCFANPLTHIGLAASGGYREGQSGQQQGDYLFANITYNNAFMALANFTGNSTISAVPGAIQLLSLQDRSHFVDSDHDGAADWLEIQRGTGVHDADSDDDGLSDGTEMLGTNPTNPLRADTDSDGAPDGVEDSNHNGQVDAGETSPTDNDSDNDRVSDGVEIAHGSNPLDNDSDDDGLDDYEEIVTYGTNPAVADSDGDDLTDYQEVGLYATNPTRADSDNDGIPDGQDVSAFRNFLLTSVPAVAFKPGTHSQLLAALQTVEDALAASRRANAVRPLEDLLLRFDGCARRGSPDRNDWLIECSTQTFFQGHFQQFLGNVGQDSDHDKLWDWLEDRNGNGTVDRRETDPHTADSDGDGLLDGMDVEFIQNLLRRLAATAFLDTTVRQTMLAELETVEQQLRSRVRVSRPMARLTRLRLRMDGCSSAPDSSDWIIECTGQRLVRDGLDRLVRNWQVDSDGDGLWDWEEDVNRNGIVEAGETDPHNADSDGDVIPDGRERLGSNHTDPLNVDTDGDGLWDRDEDWSHNGARDPGETDPRDPDTDDDGASDGDEFQQSDMLDPDTDDDELLDGLELFNPVTFVSDNDSDDDRILDGEDVDYIVHTVESLPNPAFRNVAQRTLIVNEVRTIEQSIASSNRALALTQLGSLRQRVNGCGSAPDSTDWIIDCTGQKDVRTYIDLLITNLSN